MIRHDRERKSRITQPVTYSRQGTEEVLRTPEILAAALDTAEQAGRRACSYSCKVEVNGTDLTGTATEHGLNLRVECIMRGCNEKGIDTATEVFTRNLNTDTHT